MMPVVSLTVSGLAPSEVGYILDEAFGISPASASAALPRPTAPSAPSRRDRPPRARLLHHPGRHRVHPGGSAGDRRQGGEAVIDSPDPGVVAFHATYAVLKAERHSRGSASGEDDTGAAPDFLQLRHRHPLAWADLERVREVIDRCTRTRGDLPADARRDLRTPGGRPPALNPPGQPPSSTSRGGGWYSGSRSGAVGSLVGPGLQSGRRALITSRWVRFPHAPATYAIVSLPQRLSPLTSPMTAGKGTPSSAAPQGTRRPTRRAGRCEPSEVWGSKTGSSKTRSTPAPP